jgi:hypothetical protein
LRADDRIHTERTHVYTSFQDYLGYGRRDEDGPRDIHSLDHDYPGVLLEVIDADEKLGRDALDEWLQTDYVPWVQRGAHTPVAMTLRFAPQPLPPDKQPDVADIPGVDRRITLVHFLHEDPRLRWMTRFSRHGMHLETARKGRLQLCAPFIAVAHGTNRYVDQLRDEPD